MLVEYVDSAYFCIFISHGFCGYYGYYGCHSNHNAIVLLFEARSQMLSTDVHHVMSCTWIPFNDEPRGHGLSAVLNLPLV